MSSKKLDEKKNKAIQKQIKKLSKKVNVKAKASESQFSISMRRFKRNKVGILGLGIIIIMFALGIFATPMEVEVGYRNDELFSYDWGGLTPYSPEEFFDIQVYNSSNYSDPDCLIPGNYSDSNPCRGTLYAPGYKPPGEYTGYIYDNKENFTQSREVILNHVFGTNADSQDLLSRLILGARISIFVSVGAILLALSIGLPVGLMAGFYGGRVDEILMRITDLFLNLPFYLLILMSIKLFYENAELEQFLTTLKLEGEFFIFAIILGLGIFGWTGIARLIRAQIFQIKSMDYVEAARALGASPNRIMVRHILPNVLVALIVVLSIGMGANIVIEAAISFLLFDTTGVASWGVEISRGLSTLSVAWWPVIFPGIFITVAVLGFNLLGDALNDAFDPRAR